MKSKTSKFQFVQAECPNCGGALNLDETTNHANCPNCGTHFFVQNKGADALDKVFGFIERQQAIRRKTKQEKQERKEREEAARKNHLKKLWWAYVLGIILLIAFCVTMSILENQGIV